MTEADADGVRLDVDVAGLETSVAYEYTVLEIDGGRARLAVEHVQEMDGTVVENGIEITGS